MSIAARDWIRHHARMRPHALAFLDDTSGERISYSTLDRRIDALAHHLASRLGVKAGDRVALLAASHPDVFALQFACARAGAIFLPLNWRLAHRELAFIVTDARVSVIVADALHRDVAAHLRGVLGGAPFMEIGDVAEPLADAPARVEAGAWLPASVGDDWMLLYTSGTTGLPKGARLTHGQALWQVTGLGTEYGVTPASVALTYTPTFHASGLFLFANVMMYFGGAVILMRQFDPAACLRRFVERELRVTHSLAVPTNLQLIREQEGFAGADLSGVVIPCGGAPVPTTLIRAYAERGAVIPQVWGMTELCGVGTTLRADHAVERIGSAGIGLLGLDVKIVDADGRDVGGPGEVGEVVVRGPLVTPGYWGKDADRERYFLEGGWFRTGDAGRLDTDGFLYIVDRWKDMYISGGENVYPAEVEAVLYQLPDVREAAVVGVAHEKWGEVGRAHLVLAEGSALSEAAVVEFCQANLARYKVPKYVRFERELPHSATGKVLKHALITPEERKWPT